MKEGLTVTYDVFKFENMDYTYIKKEGLTVTYDVFKYSIKTI